MDRWRRGALLKSQTLIPPNVLNSLVKPFAAVKVLQFRNILSQRWELLYE